VTPAGTPTCLRLHRNVLVLDKVQKSMSIVVRWCA